MNKTNIGFGSGFSVGLSSYDRDLHILSLSDSSKLPISDDGSIVSIKETENRNLSFRISEDERWYIITYEDGTIELLDGPSKGGNIKFAQSIIAPDGHRIEIIWDRQHDQPRLNQIINENREVLLLAEYPSPSQTIITVFSFGKTQIPNEEYKFYFTLKDDFLAKISSNFKGNVTKTRNQKHIITSNARTHTDLTTNRRSDEEGNAFRVIREVACEISSLPDDTINNCVETYEFEYTSSDKITIIDQSSFVYGDHIERGKDTLSASALGYNGERRSEVLGGYHLGNGYRLYSPELRRFTSPDSMSPFDSGGINAYAYCEGDPINNIDPTGHGIFGDLWRDIRAPRKAFQRLRGRGEYDVRQGEMDFLGERGASRLNRVVDWGENIGQMAGEPELEGFGLAAKVVEDEQQGGAALRTFHKMNSTKIHEFDDGHIILANQNDALIELSYEHGASTSEPNIANTHYHQILAEEESRYVTQRTETAGEPQVRVGIYTNIPNTLNTITDDEANRHVGLYKNHYNAIDDLMHDYFCRDPRPSTPELAEKLNVMKSAGIRLQEQHRILMYLRPSVSNQQARIIDKLFRDFPFPRQQI